MLSIQLFKQFTLFRSDKWVWIFPMLALIYPLSVFCGGPVQLYFPESRPDTYLTLYGPNNQTTVVAENDDIIPGTQISRIVEDLTAESTYYIKVSVFDNPNIDDTGYYLISVSGPAGSTITSASEDIVPLTVNADPVRAQLETENDEDWFIFQTAEAVTYTIDTTFDPEHSAAGIPVTWKELPITYNIDRGPLGVMNNEDASNLIQNSIGIWNNVSMSKAKLEKGSDLSFDFDVQTFGPNPRFLPQLFYDQTRNKVMLFGGLDPAYNLFFSDLWEWDGDAWTIIPLENHPLQRYAFGAAYDTENQHWIIFGGSSNQGDLNDTWIWDGEAWTQKQPENSPSPRSTMAMVYDEARGQTILFGGDSEDGFLNDTWLWDEENWSEVTSSTSPSPRAGFDLFYDPVRQTVVLFSGYHDDGNPNDLWEWDGEQWSEIPFSNGPVARDSYAVAYDRVQQVALLFGGYDEEGNRLNDTWAWDGSSWTQLFPENKPSPRQLHAMAYDAEHNQIVLFGGEYAQADSYNEKIFGETWIWNGQNWNQLSNSQEIFKIREQLFSQGINPVIFDNKGELVDLLFGAGSRGNILGFAGPQIIEKSEIKSGWAVLNGWYVNNENQDKLNSITQTMSHEFGHFIGLGHAQFYGHLSRNNYAPDDSHYPLMYWLKSFAAEELPPTLHYDDEVALSRLYPLDDNILGRDLGTITGRAIFASGKPVLGGMVSARLVSDRFNTVVGTQTDTFETMTGEFTLPGLPPGDYEVWIEPVDPDSTVSIHRSFSKSHPVRPEYYNTDNESGDPANDNPSFVKTVSVSAGQETQVELICEELNNDNELKTQLLGFGSPMIGGFGVPQRQHNQIPFSVIVNDDIEDLSMSVSPYEQQTAAMEIFLGDTIVFTSNDSPGERQNADIVYDSSHEKLWFFGGGEVVAKNDLWSFDGEQWEFFPRLLVPPTRADHAMACDEDRNKVVVFGGIHTSDQLLNDTWEWDGESWTKIRTNVSPSKRARFEMAYDSNRNKIVLFGGSDEKDLLNETWEYDGNNWTQIFTANEPSKRWFSAMAYDSNRKTMVLFGGGSDESRLNDTWEYDGEQWTEIETADAPEPRAGQAMVYDSIRKVMVLFGGRTEEGRQNDTWEYDGENWTEVTPSVSPSKRSPTHQMVYDKLHEKVILYGGLSEDGSSLGDMWEFDGIQWTQINQPDSIDPGAEVSVTLTRSGENGLFALQNGTYFITINNIGNIPGNYTIMASSSSVDEDTPVQTWEIY